LIIYFPSTEKKVFDEQPIFKNREEPNEQEIVESLSMSELNHRLRRLKYFTRSTDDNSLTKRDERSGRRNHETEIS
jgi:hypothetical protein